MNLCSTEQRELPDWRAGVSCARTSRLPYLTRFQAHTNQFRRRPSCVPSSAVSRSFCSAVSHSARQPEHRTPTPSPRCGGGPSDRCVPVARVRSPASRASRTSSTSASTTAACGAPPTTARTGRRCSMSSPPDPSAPLPSRRRIPTSSTSAPAPASSVPTSPPATASTSPPTPARPGPHLGLATASMIAMIDVDPRNPDRLFVAVLGHPYGPNAERGVFRSTDGGRTFQKVLYKDEYTSANDVRIDPSDPNTVYATLWQQQESFIEGRAFGGTGDGIFKSTDGGTTWKQLTDGLPTVIQANLAIAPSNSHVLYAAVAGTTPGAATPSTTGVVGFYKSTDGGEHWNLVLARVGHRPHAGRAGPAPHGAHRRRRPADAHRRPEERERRLQRIHRLLAHRGRRPYLDCRARRTRRRRLPEIWVNPNDPNIILVVADQGGVVSAQSRLHRGATGTTSPPPRCITSPPTTRFPTASAAASRTPARRAWRAGRMTARSPSTTGTRSTSRSTASPRPTRRIRDLVYGSGAPVSRSTTATPAQTTQVGPEPAARSEARSFGRNVRTMPHRTGHPSTRTCCSTRRTPCGRAPTTRTAGRASARDLARQTWAAPANAGKYAGTIPPSPLGTITRSVPVAAQPQRALGRHG